MLEKEKKLIIEKIQNSKMDLSLIFSGCGFQFLNNILKVSGSSKFFINAEFPYSKKILENRYQLKNPFVSKKNAEKICSKSISELNNLKNKVYPKGRSTMGMPGTKPKKAIKKWKPKK